MGENHLHIALLISLYLKYALICLFALLFFLRVLKYEKAAAVCALLWTFSGYAVLWGQHYHFLTAILGFTVAVWGFQLYLDGSRWRFLAVPAVAVLAVTSYYHLYIACFFFLIYGIVWLSCRGEKPGAIAKKAGGFVLYMIPVLLLAGETVLPAVFNFLSSARVSQVTSSASVPLVYEPKVLVAYAARLLSNDLIGTGDGFRGPTNYYECAILHVSVLFLFALCYLLTGPKKGRVLLIAGGCVLALCLPVVSRILVFSTTAQRWTYLLAFAQVIAIGLCLSDVMRTWGSARCRRRMGLALLMADGLLAVLLGALVMCHIYTGGWLLNRKACGILVLTVGIYHLVFFLAGKKKLPAFALLSVAVAAELLLGNYACVNDRQTVPVEQWYGSMYYDGSRDAVQWIAGYDEGLYRVSKTEPAVNDCDPLIQGYRGVSVYNSTNAAELVALANSFGYNQAGNHVRFEGTDLLSNTMLGVKYVIAGAEESLNPAYYEKLYENATHAVYENRFWLGFGYLYSQQTDKASALAGTGLERAVELSRAYYLTGEEGGEGAHTPVTLDLLPHLVSGENCVWETAGELVVTGTGTGMQLVFDVPAVPEGMLAAGIRLEMDAAASAAVCLMTAAGDTPFDASRYDIVYYPAGSGVYWLDALTDTNPDRVRLDLSWIPQTIRLTGVELVLVEEAVLRRNLTALQETAVTDMDRDGNTLRCQTRVDEPGGAMLCVPLLYSGNWSVTVDGQPAQAVSINGGLVGVPLSQGTHSVAFSYVNAHYGMGLALSGLAALSFIAFLYQRKHGRKAVK